MDYQDYGCEWDTCPNCQDNCVEIADEPIWATDQGEIYEIVCPVCGVVDTWAEFIDNEEADAMEAFFAESRCFWMNVDGQVAHVLGDPNMSPETLNALKEVIKAAVKMVDKDKPVTDKPPSQI